MNGLAACGAKALGLLCRIWRAQAHEATQNRGLQRHVTTCLAHSQTSTQGNPMSLIANIVVGLIGVLHV